MADDPKKPEKETIPLEDFVSTLDASKTLKGMFQHYYGVRKATPAKSKEEWTALFNAFKDTPLSKLK